MRKTTWIRLGLLALTLGVVGVVLARTGWADHLSVDRIRAAADGAGLAGLAVFVGAFTVGLFAQVPGFVFITAAALAYGPAQGGLVALVGALVATSVSFVVVRLIGGRALDDVRHPRMQRLLDGLDRRPVRTIAVLRTFFQVAPPLNYALALSRTPFHAYLAGSAAGLVAPVFVLTTLAHCTLG